MLADVLMLADDHMGVSDSIYDPERYMYLTDSIINEIERSREPQLEEARKLIKRIRKRDLYRCVDAKILEQHLHDPTLRKEINEERFILFARSEDGAFNLRENDIRIEFLDLNYGRIDIFFILKFNFSFDREKGLQSHGQCQILH